MTKDEIKKGLECCITLKADSCKECPYGNTDCSSDKLQRDALNLITEQEEHIKIQNQQLSNWEKNYTQSFERLKAQQREIDKLKADNKQAQIDVLNRVMTYINNKIENDYGDMSDSVKYLTVDIDDFDDFIDELIKEVQNGEDKG